MKTQQVEHTRFNNRFFHTTAFAKSFSDNMQQGIQNCILCHQVCEHTLAYALDKGMMAEQAYLQSLVDCAQMCILSADFMLRKSRQHHLTCDACAEICLACARSCEALDPKDEMLQACADICRQCAESCQQMAKLN